MKNRLMFIISAWLLTILFPMGLKAATSIDITNPSVNAGSGWKNVFPQNGNYDYVGDTRTTGSSSLDIVGDATYPAVYIQFSDDGSELAVRIRVNNCDGSSANPLFSNFAYIGIDADLSGAIDFFIGAYNPTGAGRLGVYLSDPEAPNTMYGVTGIDGVLATFQPIDGVNYSMVKTEDGSNFSGDPDYFITFKFNVADIESAIGDFTKDHVTFTPNTPFSFFAGTSTTDRTLNGDVNGLDNREMRPFPLWIEVGSDPISTDNTNWTIHIVSFDKNGGDIDEYPQTIRVADGKPIMVFPTPPVRYGFHLIGWSTDPDDNETLVHGFPLHSIVTGDITLYAIWKSFYSDLEFIEELLHFDARGGNATNGSTFKNTDPPAALTPNYRHLWSNDDLIKIQPVPTNPPTVNLPNNNNHYEFAGWVADVRNYGYGGANNIIQFSGSAQSLSTTTINFFTWTEPVTNTTEVLQSHSGEMERTVYALWYVVANNQGGTLTFYDNIYGDGVLTQTPGGSEVYSEYVTNAGNAAFNPKPVARQGFLFRGWSTTMNAAVGTYLDPLNPSSQKLTAPSNKFPSNAGQNTNLYAIWEPLNYIVNFLPNTVDHILNPLIGTPSGVPTYRNCPYIDKAGLRYPNPFPPQPALTGYTFLEWNTRPDGSGFSVDASGIGDVISRGDLIRFTLFSHSSPDNPLIIDGNEISGYLNLYAIWDRGDDPVPINSLITFDAMGGHFIGDFTIGGTYGHEQIKVPAVDGYIEFVPVPVWEETNQYGEPLFVFAGWSYSDAENRTVADPAIAAHRTNPHLLEDITLYAVWIPNASITFHPNGGYWPDGTVYSIRVSIDGDGFALYVPGFYGDPDNHPNRDGYTFKEWNTAIEGGGSIYHRETILVIGTMNVYAQWVEPGIDSEVAIYFDFNHGTNEIISYTADRNSKIIKLDPDPDRDGWIFNGWYTEPNCINEWNFDTVISTYCPACAYIYLYARWSRDPNLLQYLNIIINRHLIQK